jgi:hypothetical protein
MSYQKAGLRAPCLFATYYTTQRGGTDLLKLKSNEYVIVRDMDVRMSHSFVPVEKFGSVRKIEEAHGWGLNVMGADRNLLYFYLDSKAMYQFQLQLDSYLVAENAELRQELTELRGDTDDD